MIQYNIVFVFLAPYKQYIFVYKSFQLTSLIFDIMMTLDYCSIDKKFYGCEGEACREGKKERKGERKRMVEGKVGN
jgi:hypothetical protein